MLPDTFSPFRIETPARARGCLTCTAKRRPEWFVELPMPDDAREKVHARRESEGEPAS